ncbi:Predicted arabinose efflux permease, MFS family [Tistlia consotensis]|uniref:Predicted arabinose efflux permease, MFS family n=1 Tax=Tistlia consotensis USBA 355 TaxID=560819 RepID=A0A1Y6BA81_9PROT|nr:YbfB/YjiJ family MFS transporter [Tistlia consotensis]SME99567.1 Predicted arabinose efflux permease, MFS family [Tistlia consotensis USBA 355]SNR76626.1 Predicted arabinose efflux permease, MFS family [Tistlia consotensis]
MADTIVREARGHAVPPVRVRRALLCAFCASLIGIGLARFAYTPLLPAIIGAGWFGPSAAAYLGAANLAGYLAGALLGRPMAARLPPVALLRAMMLVATAAFFACAWPLSVPWFFVWRFAAGWAGGALMVLAAPSVLPHVPPARRGLAGGAIFMGVGVGVALSGTLVPLLLEQGLRQAWYGLGGLSLLLTAAGWAGWPGDAAPAAAPAVQPHPPRPGRLRALYAEYALNAAGWVPHMIFLVDFVARGLGQGIEAGAAYWVLFGLGATAGPILAGALADRTGFGTALRLAFLLEACAVAIPALGLGQAWLIASSVVVGAFVTGTVPLMLGRIGELLPHHPAQQKAAWSRATAAFALFQAAAAYLLSFVFAESGGDYRLLFVAGTAAMVLALAIDLAAGPAASGRGPGGGRHRAGHGIAK